MALSDNDKLDLAARWLADADGLLITAGAGMGVDSGLPAFRGRRGLWRAYPALRHLKVRFAEISTEAAFRRSPTLAWGFHGHLLQLFRAATPHDGFRILRRWGETLKHGCFVFTSNVDGAFEKAGYDVNRIVECHGSLHFMQCAGGCGAHVWSADSFQPIVDLATCRLVSNLPRCPHCGGITRPNVLLFDDDNWIDTKLARQRENWLRWRDAIQRPVVIELGAGKAIPTVRYFTEQMMQRIVRINPHDYKIANGRGVGLKGGALDVLKRLAARLEEGQENQATRPNLTLSGVRRNEVIEAGTEPGTGSEDR